MLEFRDEDHCRKPQTSSFSPRGSLAGLQQEIQLSQGEPLNTALSPISPPSLHFFVCPMFPPFQLSQYSGLGPHTPPGELTPSVVLMSYSCRVPPLPCLPSSAWCRGFTLRSHCHLPIKRNPPFHVPPSAHLPSSLKLSLPISQSLPEALPFRSVSKGCRKERVFLNLVISIVCLLPLLLPLP